MESNIMMALQLMAVGMITVFIILMIVIYLGKGLIVLVNKIAPEEVASVKRVAGGSPAIDATTQAVIDATVSQLTNGKGRVKSVKKV